MKFSIRLIQTTLAAFLCSLVTSVAMEAKDPEVEIFNKKQKSVPVLKDYPNQIPKSQLLMLLKKPESEDILEKRDTTQYSFQVVRSIMTNNGFKELEKTFSNPLSVYIRNTEKNISDCVIFNFKAFASNKTFTPTFYNLERTVNPSSKRKDKWERQTKIEYDENKTELVHEMSWRYIDFALHFSRKFHVTHSDLEEILYSKIKKIGFQNALIRLTIVSDAVNHIYGFNVLYDNEIERNIGKNFLFNLIVPGNSVPIEEEIPSQINREEKKTVETKKCNIF